MQITLEIRDEQAMAAFNKAPQVMERSLERFLSRGAHEIARTATEKSPKAFSTLAASIRAFQVEPLHWRVAPGVKYAPWVEDGTEPHFPNSSNLVPWVERVLGKRGEEAEKTAFLVARAISRRGTRSQKYMQPAAVENESRVLALLRQGVDEGIREVFA